MKKILLLLFLFLSFSLNLGFSQVIAKRYTEAWDDMQGKPLAVSGASQQLTEEQFGDVTQYIKKFMRHDQDDYFAYDFQFTHKKKLGSNVELHIHYIPMVVPATNQNVYFEIKYCWTINTTVVPANSSWTTTYATITIPSTVSLYQTLIGELVASIPASASETYSSVLRVVVSRLGTNVNDTYTTSKASGTGQANLCLDYVDVHYQTDRLGSKNEAAD